jgi:murein DD-endopeptidase MepM/ murein hydrolase activator NlpD
MPLVRKVPVVPAALGAVLTLLALPSLVEARPAPAKQDARRSPARKTAATHPRRAKTLIYQDDAGQVVIDRVEVVGLNANGPELPAEPHNYPQPLCEPADTVREATLHDAETGDAETPEVQVAEVSREPASAGGPSGLSRIAQRVGSFFRPKSSLARVRPEDVDLDALLSGGLLIPVEGVDIQKLRDSFLSQRGKYAQHLAIDIGAPRGTPVLATTDGQIVRMTREQRGGKSLYQKDATGKYLLFYCHLSGYAQGSRVGQEVRKGDVIGYVGSTGHVIGGPHLHFSITRVPEDSGNFRNGLAINPYLLFLAGVP